MQPISDTIYTDSFVIVFEMINDTNTIAGIGIVKNSVDIKRNVSIYSNINYNNYVYESKYRIDASDLNSEEENRIAYCGDTVIYSEHSPERGQGITTITDSFLQRQKVIWRSRIMDKDKKDSIHSIIKKYTITMIKVKLLR